MLVPTILLFADPTAEEEAFLRVPHAVSPKQADHVFDASALPPAMSDVLSGYDWRTRGGALPPQFHGFTFDLNKDGRPEYFIRTIYGGSGGPDYIILTQSDEHTWRAIGGFQGGLRVIDTAAGWPELVTISRGGGGVWAKTHQIFRDGKYVPVFIEHYHRGVVTQEQVHE